MSLVDELTIHPAEHYCDFDDGKHNIAVFGLGLNALMTEARIEAIPTEVAPDKVSDADYQAPAMPVSLS